MSASWSKHGADDILVNNAATIAPKLATMTTVPGTRSDTKLTGFRGDKAYLKQCSQQKGTILTLLPSGLRRSTAVHYATSRRQIGFKNALA